MGENTHSNTATKRKRENEYLRELEVDVSAPEPPSKKAMRRAKKGRPAEPSKSVGSAAIDSRADSKKETQENPPTQARQSEFGVWIGNLAWTTAKADLRNFLTEGTEITEEAITRIHMPPPKSSATKQVPKPLNGGFAYVDFASLEDLAQALTLSESMLGGRRLLIKDSKNYEGRPEKKSIVDHGLEGAKVGKAPNERIFVGNLGFDTTKEDLQKHFEKCGEISHIQVATFEDSGNCKGYAWVEFGDLDAAKAAVRGWVKMGRGSGSVDREESNSEADKDLRSIKGSKLQKRKINKLQGRLLRMEFAEDKTTRYKKRFGKEPADPELDINGHRGTGPKRNEKSQSTRDRSSVKPSAKTVERAKRSANTSGAPIETARQTGSITQSYGKKTILA